MSPPVDPRWRPVIPEDGILICWVVSNPGSKRSRDLQHSTLFLDGARQVIVEDQSGQSSGHLCRSYSSTCSMTNKHSTPFILKVLEVGNWGSPELRETRLRRLFNFRVLGFQKWNHENILSEISDFYMVIKSPVVVWALLMRMMTLLSVDEILLPKYMKWSSNFRGLSCN